LEIDVEHVAKLANLPLDEKRLEILGKQLTETLLYIDRLNEIPTEKVEPTSQVTGLTNITRADTVSAPLSQEAAVGNAPETHNGYIVVDAILEE
jgi:aspartyl-tRNA(Asn)/glutamyl-tRNA(Gln) amidotransferase subunit C